MITRIEIDGFKSFRNFAIDLRPFQIFIGPNGSGKSNLFDAIVLLSHLAGDNTVRDAFRKNRGDIGELFTLNPDGSRAQQMSFAVEMLIAKTITDESLGVKENVSSTRLRYELKIERRAENGFERLYVAHESLTSIRDDGDGDKWVEKNVPLLMRKSWIVYKRRAPYISTGPKEGTDQLYVFRHQDRRSGAKQETPLGQLGRTVLGLINTIEYPTAFAARQELLSWQFLQLNPTDLRKPSDIHSTTELLPDGSNLAAVLHRMSSEDEYALTDVSRDMANLVSGVLEISVRPIQEREEFMIEAQMEDKTTLSSRVLSDGTLRLLAFVTLKYDPHYRGVLCLEEPENGVHPFRLQQIVKLLQNLATDFNKQDDEDSPPRQVLMNTHSPSLIPYVSPDDSLFVDIQRRGKNRSTRMLSVHAEPIPTPNQENYYTWAQVRRYLDQAPAQQMLEKFEHKE